jgi:P27 family predicted phage terminase small subunit
VAGGLIRVEVPEELNADGAAEFERLAALLIAAGRLQAEDLPILTAFCSTWALFLTAQRWVNDNGVQVEFRDKDGELAGVSVAPYVMVLERAQTRLATLGKELGLTHGGRLKTELAERRLLNGSQQNAERSRLAGRLGRLIGEGD